MKEKWKMDEKFSHLEKRKFSLCLSSVCLVFFFFCESISLSNENTFHALLSSFSGWIITICIVWMKTRAIAGRERRWGKNKQRVKIVFHDITQMRKSGNVNSCFSKLHVKCSFFTWALTRFFSLSWRIKHLCENVGNVNIYENVFYVWYFNYGWILSWNNLKIFH